MPKTVTTGRGAIDRPTLIDSKSGLGSDDDKIANWNTLHYATRGFGRGVIELCNVS